MGLWKQSPSSMGVFSSKKKTYVTSVTYPLGEDDGDHTPYLEYTTLNAVLQNLPIAESISQGYLRGQGISLRSAFRYARDYYTHGVPNSNVAYSSIPDPDVLIDILEDLHPGNDIVLRGTKLGTADFFYWGDQYMAETYGYDPYLGEMLTPPSGVDADAEIFYDIDESDLLTILMVNADTTTHMESFTPTDFERMKDYVHAGYQTKTTTVTGPTTTTRPAEPGEVDHETVTEVQVTPYQHETTHVATTVLAGTATDVTTITTIDLSRPIFWMYLVGSGTYPDLDGWVAAEDLVSPYYPSIPVRVDNEDFLDEEHQETELYKTGKKMLKKVGIKLEDIRENVNDNEDIDDIDYCYVTFGVNLNAKSQECRRYLFRFFEHLQGISDISEGDFDAWDPDSGTSPPTNVLKIFSPINRDQHHDIELQWQYINTTVHVGEIFTGAKADDVMVAINGERQEFEFLHDSILDTSSLLVQKQLSGGAYVQLEIIGLTYENHVYNGKSVSLTAYDSLVTEEGEEEEEGFILPLNYEIVRTTPMVEMTDLAYQCNHLVFNCYKVVKEKWYQSLLFKIIVVIISILIIVWTWGAGTPAAANLLAGVFLVAGLSVTLAAFLAATIYVLGMMILMSILSKVAIELFGPKWGPIIAAVALFVSQNWAALTKAFSTAATQGLSTIITAQNIIQASTVALDAYGMYAQAQMADIAKKAAGLWTEFDEQMTEIERLTKLNLDTNLDMIDIQGFTRATNLAFFETPGTFFQRTLLTGSDICEITAGLVSDFAAVGLLLPTQR